MTLLIRRRLRARIIEGWRCSPARPTPFELTTDLAWPPPLHFRMAEVRPHVDGIIQKRMFEEGSELEGRDSCIRSTRAVIQSA